MSIALSSESRAWLRATQAGVELPAAVQEAAQRLEKIDAALEGIGSAPPPTVTADKLMAGGMALDKAQARAAESETVVDRWHEMRRIGTGERDGARLGLNRVTAAHRDELVLSIRPLITAMVEEARPVAEVLAPFHPSYAANDIVHRGGPEHLAAYQASVELERRWGLLVSAWRASFRAAKAEPGSFDVREVPQETLYWERPGRVRCDRVNGQRLNRFGHPTAIEPTVLLIASEDAKAGFRLATLTELADVYAERHATAPQPMGSTRRGWSF